MPKVHFVARFDWPIPGTANRQSIQYLPGMRELVTTPCAEAAVAAGAAIWIEKPEEPPPAPPAEPAVDPEAAALAAKAESREAKAPRRNASR